MTLLINGTNQSDIGNTPIVVSVPIEEGLRVTNIFVDPSTGKVTVEYEDNL